MMNKIVRLDSQVELNADLEAFNEPVAEELEAISYEERADGEYDEEEEEFLGQLEHDAQQYATEMEKKSKKSKEETQSEEVDEKAVTNMYFQDMKKYKLLSAEQERALGERIFKGNEAEKFMAEQEPSEEERAYLLQVVEDGKAAQQELIQANLRLVVKKAYRYLGKGLSLMDLVQEGNVGLIRAAAKFDVTKGFRFSTYATWWLKQSFQRALIDKGHAVRIPVHTHEKILRIKRAQKELSMQRGYDVSLREVAQELSLDVKQVEDLILKSTDTLSLNAPLGDEDNYTLEDTVAGNAFISPEEKVEINERRQAIEMAFTHLRPKEVDVLRLRYGFGGRPHTLEEVGEIYGISRERVRQIEKNALIKLCRVPSIKNALLEFWPNGHAC